MTKRQAEMWAEEITKILTGKPLITVSVTPIGLSIQQNQTFDRCYIVDLSEDNCAVGIVESSGSVSGNEGWEIIPDQRMITLEKINGFGEPLIFAWCVIDNDGSNIWQEMREENSKLFKDGAVIIDPSEIENDIATQKAACHCKELLPLGRMGWFEIPHSGCGDDRGLLGSIWDE